MDIYNNVASICNWYDQDVLGCRNPQPQSRQDAVANLPNPLSSHYPRSRTPEKIISLLHQQARTHLKPNFVTKQSTFRAKVGSFDEGVATATSRRNSRLAADNEIVAVGSRFRDRF